MSSEPRGIRTIYQLFTYLSGMGNKQLIPGYTFLIFFLENGSNNPDQEIGPPNFENAVAPSTWRIQFERRCGLVSNYSGNSLSIW